MDTTTTGVPLTAVALAFTRVVNYALGEKEGWPLTNADWDARTVRVMREWLDFKSVLLAIVEHGDHLPDED
jgi:hypothetical protein